MTIPAAAKPTPLEQPHDLLQITDRDGRLTEYGSQLLESIHSYMNGGNRVIPCSASTTSNVITLTPNDASPILEKYNDYEIFVFAADATTDGAVTATVVPATGSFDTIKVYKTAGAAQAGSGDVVEDSVYMLLYADHLDTAAGGFVLK